MRRWLLTLAAIAAAAPAWAAEQIVVTNYGIAANAMPYAVAMEKGFFKQEGADISGILTSAGGGTTLRTMLGGSLPFAETDLASSVTAIQQGADIKIVAETGQTVAEFAWAAKKGSPIKTLADLKGKKIGFTNPKSTSQALNILLLDQIGLKQTDAELVRVGGYGEQIVALGMGSIDVATLVDPVWSKHAADLQPIAFAVDVVQPLCDVIAVASGEAMRTKGDFIRSVLRARRKAVEFMHANPDEAGDIVGKVYNLDPAVARAAIKRLVAPSKSGLPYWGPGNFDFAGMDRMLNAQRLVGAFEGSADWAKLTDDRFLPDDLRQKK